MNGWRVLETSRLLLASAGWSELTVSDYESSVKRIRAHAGAHAGHRAYVAWRHSEPRVHSDTNARVVRCDAPALDEEESVAFVLAALRC
jgi:hypothetical protein